MTLNVGKEIAALQRLTVKELRVRYAEAFGECTNANNRDWLIKRIVWRVQALAEGGLSERARRRAAELANDADLRLSPPKVKAVPTEATGRTMTGVLAGKADERLPMPGTIITRVYKGQTLQVRILAKGFEYAGEVYKSLSAVAKAVTGSHCNGYAFFRLETEVAS
ncbi:MAG TPA: DUF2924 domain-containing protein [Gemmataceae bacterium]|jgi:hypothetical protein